MHSTNISLSSFYRPGSVLDNENKIVKKIGPHSWDLYFRQKKESINFEDVMSESLKNNQGNMVEGDGGQSRDGLLREEPSLHMAIWFNHTELKFFQAEATCVKSRRWGLGLLEDRKKASLAQGQGKRGRMIHAVSLEVREVVNKAQIMWILVGQVEKMGFHSMSYLEVTEGLQAERAKY